MKTLVIVFVMGLISIFDCRVDDEEYQVGGLVDGDGNVYSTVVIGSLKWMVENWKFNAVGSRVYDDVEANESIYGRLYNWGQAMSLNLPNGWRIPSSPDWGTLADIYGQNPGKVKEAGLLYWDAPNVGNDNLPSDNASGFCGRGSGNYDLVMGMYLEKKVTAFHWTTTEDIDPLKAMAGDLWHGYNVLCAGIATRKELFVSVRLCRNN